MVLELDLNVIKDRKELTPTLFCYLAYMVRGGSLLDGDVFPWKVSPEELIILEDAGWIKIGTEGVTLRKKTFNFFSKSSVKLDPETWISEWREIFPAIKGNSGRPLRGDKQGCLRKMKQFISKYPEFTKDEIFNGTLDYVLDMKSKNYNFMVCADYFILKDNISLLASIIEYSNNRTIDYNKRQEENSDFHTTV